MIKTVERTVLFADLRGSTSMYETLGNADATAVVTRSVALLATVGTGFNASVPTIAGTSATGNDTYVIAKNAALCRPGLRPLHDDLVLPP